MPRKPRPRRDPDAEAYARDMAAAAEKLEEVFDAADDEHAAMARLKEKIKAVFEKAERENLWEYPVNLNTQELEFLSGVVFHQYHGPGTRNPVTALRPEVILTFEQDERLRSRLEAAVQALRKYFPRERAGECGSIPSISTPRAKLPYNTTPTS
jgi:hypothetical protein